MPSSRARQGNRRPSDRLESFLAQVPGVDYGVLDELLGYALRRAQLRIYQDFFEALDAWNITPPRFSAMTLIHHNAGMKLTELAQAMGIARSGAVDVVNSLEKLGFVRRQAAEHDRRAHALELTPEGVRAYGEIAAAIRAHDARISTKLSADEQAQLRHLLGLLGTA